MDYICGIKSVRRGKLRVREERKVENYTRQSGGVCAGAHRLECVGIRGREEDGVVTLYLLVQFQ